MSELAATVIDVSQFNGTVDWSSVTADGAIIRLGYRGYGSKGTLVTDSKFSANTSGAASADIPYGVYWLSQATSDSEAEEEAAYVIDALQGLNLTFPVYLDSEYSNTAHTGRADSLSKTERTQYALTWLKAIEAAGYTAGVYASESWFSDNLNVSKLTDYCLWVAKYSLRPPDIGVYYDAWQYTESGSDPGCSGDVDVSHFYRDFISEKNAEEDNEVLSYEEWKTYMDRYLTELAAEAGSSWSQDARDWAVANGLFQGDADGNLMWKSFVTRETAATLFQRVIGD